jgi:hypothetical protein
MNTAIQKVCSDGTTASTLSIAFGSIAAASTVVAGYFLYRGYLSGGGERPAADATPPENNGRPKSVLGSLRLVPSFSTNGAGATATFQF